ncbi:glucose 1-dehydrogenase [Nocardioides sp.]|uniref:SDR family NAD(P)-dependent oxidoreductase n=1 Tax=Nocardioides sp. TaxID=35761 RepID=UPI00261F4496|nr:glucose 1-dehydrogenase [Nocardioides sp.]
MSFTDKIAFVTGAGSGIGRATSLALAAAGATVYAADINGDSVTAAVREIEAAGGAAHALVTDVSDAAALRAAFDEIRARSGRLDLAFNNAGIDGRVEPLHDITETEWTRILTVNLTSQFLCLQHEIDLMLENGGGTIVNNASVGGLLGTYFHAAYNASKHGVVGLTRSAALEYIERGIRINCVCPGAVRTQFMEELPDTVVDHLRAGTPAGRLAETSELADAVLWLLSDKSTYMVGHALAVDGGITAGDMGTKFS